MAKINLPPDKCPKCQSKNWHCKVDNLDEVIFKCDECEHVQSYDNEEFFGYEYYDDGGYSAWLRGRAYCVECQSTFDGHLDVCPNCGV